jgi:hypothetical protein
MLAFALGSAAMLGGSSAEREKATAAALVSSTVWILITCVVLCESSYGSGSVAERNLFFVMPLLFVGATAWAGRGRPRPARLTAVLVLGAIACALLMPAGSIAGTIDAQTFTLWTQIHSGSFPPVFQMRAAVLVGSLAFLRVRTDWPLVVTLVLSLFAVSAARDRPAPQPRALTARYTWIDDAVPGTDRATILWVGFSSDRCPTTPLTSELAQMAVWSEFFSLRVNQAGHLLGDNPARGLDTTRLSLTRSGIVDGADGALQPRYVVTDARVPIVGSRVALLRAGDVFPHPAAAGALALWHVDPPLRLRRPSQVTDRVERERLACGR